MTTPLYLSDVWMKNRAPFGDMRLRFAPAEVAILTALNGRGKTTVLSYITDAIFEMAKAHFRNVAPEPGAFYRVATPLDILDHTSPSMLYVRFTCADQHFDFVDLRHPCTAEQYEAISSDIPNAINFQSTIAPQLSANLIAKVISPNWTKEVAERTFNNNVLTYFPAYRFEVPAYLNEPFQTKLTYKQGARFNGILEKPIESTTAFPQIANWIMDLVLDCRVSGASSPAQQLFVNISRIMTLALSAKHAGPLRFGIGPRNFGPTRIQVLTLKEPAVQIYPTIFRLSSGEQALLTLFAEILRQADSTQPDAALAEITGVVLIDEIDKHLHIKLQKEVLPLLFGLFPKIQFISSSHSPFLGMGMADTLPERGRLIDVASGLPVAPINDPLYQEVYEMMLGDEVRFRTLYQDIQRKLDNTKKLQIITEGANTQHIQKALMLLAPEIIPQVHLIDEAKDRTGSQQLKTAFEIMCTAQHAGHFLFIWDCEVQKEYNSITETNNCWKYKFPLNPANTVTAKGVENNYPDPLFTEDLYDTITIQVDYGGQITKREFNKKRFLAKIAALDSADSFANFTGMIEKIKEILQK